MKDLTKGYPAKVIILFAIPMIFGSIFQQLYNIADSKIVSTFVGTEAFAAVGATSVVSNTLIDLRFRLRTVLEERIISGCAAWWQVLCC